MLGPSWLDGSFAERPWGPFEQQADRSQRCALAAKVISTLGSIWKRSLGDQER